MNVKRSLMFSVCVVALLTTLQQKAIAGHVETMTIDEILYQDTTTPASVALDAEVRMRVTPGAGADDGFWFLEIELTNTTVDYGDYTGSAVVLTGVGFNLQSPFSFVTTGTNDLTTHTIEQTNFDGATSTVVPGGSVDDITNDNWAFGDGSAGHFDGSPSVFNYNTVLTTFGADATGTTLQGNVADGSGPGNIDQFDYGIVSADAGLGPGAKEPWYQDFLVFKLKLNFIDGFTDATGDLLLANIQAGPVSVAFGSPLASNLDFPFPPVVAVPEPASMAMMGLGGLLVGGALVRRRKRKKS